MCDTSGRDNVARRPAMRRCKSPNLPIWLETALLEPRHGCCSSRPSVKSAFLLPVVLLSLSGGMVGGCAAPAVSPVGEGDDEEASNGQLPTPEVRGLTIVHVNVGQGDATLIKGPSRTLLVDGGDNGQGEAVLDALRAHRIPALDWVVATHPHADHIGGLDEVLDRVDAIEGVWDNGEASTTQSYAQYATAANSTTGGRNSIDIGKVFDLGDGARATCVVVNGKIADGTQVTNVDSTNDRSVGLLVEWGEFRYVIAGDLGGYASASTTDVESPLAALLGDVDVVRISHHGSRYSTNPTWLNTLMPEAAILSVGNGNDYGHPAPEVLNRLTGADAAVTVPPIDVWLTERGSAPAPFMGEGDVVISVRPTAYRIGEQLYDAVAR